MDPRDQSLHVLVLESAEYVEAGAGPVAVSRTMFSFRGSLPRNALHARLLPCVFGGGSLLAVRSRAGALERDAALTILHVLLRQAFA